VFPDGLAPCLWFMEITWFCTFRQKLSRTHARRGCPSPFCYQVANFETIGDVLDMLMHHWKDWNSRTTIDRGVRRRMKLPHIPVTRRGVSAKYP
jgi:hypothetical protein